MSNYFDDLHAAKYRQPGESFEQACVRIADACADSLKHYDALFDLLVNRRFLPGGRIQRAMGMKDHFVTPFNCYVSGTIEDSMTGIMQRVSEAAQTLRMGGGIGYDFSSLRPRGAIIKSLGSESSGPVPFMQVYDALGKCISSAGHRRGAQMAIMRIDHPDIYEFVRIKQNRHLLTSFNISVAVTEQFMRDLADGKDTPLLFRGAEVGRTDARALWDEIMQSTWDWAEPGVVFIDRINSQNNLWYCEDIAATNPCGEQPLPPFGACLLGSFNMTAYLKDDGLNPEQFEKDIHTAVRALDNVIDRAYYPLPEQKAEALSKRRMGLGVTGMANAIEVAFKAPYGSDDYLGWQTLLLQTLRTTSYEASIELAKEKGQFPALNRKAYLRSHFIAGLSEALASEINRYGIRNSHLISIAPTGTISMTAGNVSSGIEPVYDYEVRRPVTGKEQILFDWAVTNRNVYGRTAVRDVTMEEHLNVLANAQSFVDSSVSKTVNVSSSTTFEQFKGLYLKAYELGCKGLSTFRASGERAALICASGSCEV